MIHMNTLQSWSTMILLLGAVATFVWLMWESDRRRIERQHPADCAAEPDPIPEEHLAKVIELRPARRVRERASERHLILVPDSGSELTEDFYDWKVQGL